MAGSSGSNEVLGGGGSTRIEGTTGFVAIEGSLRGRDLSLQLRARAAGGNRRCRAAAAGEIRGIRRCGAAATRMEGSAGLEARGSARMEGSVGDPRKGARRERGRAAGCGAAGGDAWRMWGVRAWQNVHHGVVNAYISHIIVVEILSWIVIIISGRRVCCVADCVVALASRLVRRPGLSS
jgi:hypothetical protein